MLIVESSNMTQVEARLAKLRDKMRETDTDLVALAPGSHMRWLVGFCPHADERPCLLLVSRSAQIFLMPALNADDARTHTDIEFQLWQDDTGPETALEQALSTLAAMQARVVAVDETMRADFALLLLDALPNASHAFAADTVGLLRMRKNERELVGLRDSAASADRAVQAAFAAIRPSMTEIELADVISASFAADSAAPLFRIVGSGSNGALPHYRAGERKLQPGDSIVIDIGARRNGYPSDITRMVAVGYPPQGYEQVHAIVEAAVQAAMIAARPGVLAQTVDAAARDVITGAGYGEYFVHRTGHGIGIDGHEPPFITASSQTVLDEGMTFSIEPGIYLPGRFGIRLEEIVVLRADGPDILSALPRDLHVAEV